MLFKQQQQQQCRVSEAAFNSPPIAVSCVDVDAELHQELHNLCVSGTNSVMERSNALIIGQARILYLAEEEREREKC